MYITSRRLHFLLDKGLRIWQGPLDYGRVQRESGFEFIEGLIETSAAAVALRRGFADMILY
jgi:hypothetical protein